MSYHTLSHGSSRTVAVEGSGCEFRCEMVAMLKCAFISDLSRDLVRGVQRVRVRWGAGGVQGVRCEGHLKS